MTVGGTLILTVVPAAFGEVLVGLDIAHQLHARGERVVFLAPRQHEILLRGAPFRWGRIDLGMDRIDGVVQAVLREQGCDTLLIVDITSTFLHLNVFQPQARFPAGLDARLVGLDLWSLAETELIWDLGAERWRIPAQALQIARLVPAPLARPSVHGAYRALPKTTAEQRQAVRALRRAELGLNEATRLVITTGARWQQPESQRQATHVRLSRSLPEILLHVIAKLGPQVRHIHVGPWPLAEAPPSTRLLPQVPPAEFHALLSAADLLLCVNAAATSLVAATAAGLPSVLLVNSYAGEPDKVASRLPGADPFLRGWLDRLGTLHRFRVCPLGLYELLAPVLHDNPYATTFSIVEMLEIEAVVAACSQLLFDAAAAQAMRERQASYWASLASLPSALERFDAARREASS